MSTNLVLVEVKNYTQKTKSGYKLKTKRVIHDLIQTPTYVTEKAMSKIIAGNHDTQLLALDVYRQFLVSAHGYDYNTLDRIEELQEIIKNGAFFEAH